MWFDELLEASDAKALEIAEQVEGDLMSLDDETIEQMLSSLLQGRMFAFTNLRHTDRYPLGPRDANLFETERKPLAEFRELTARGIPSVETSGERSPERIALALTASEIFTTMLALTPDQQRRCVGLIVGLLQTPVALEVE